MITSDHGMEKSSALDISEAAPSLRKKKHRKTRGGKKGGGKRESGDGAARRRRKKYGQPQSRVVEQEQEGLRCEQRPGVTGERCGRDEGKKPSPTSKWCFGCPPIPFGDLARFS